MKVCCLFREEFSELSTKDKEFCNGSGCDGPIEIEDFDLLLTGLGTFNTDDCISYEDLKHLFDTKDCTQSCTNCNLMKREEE